MVTKQGNQNNNLLTGTDESDRLLGLAGNDTLRGRAANDFLNGGADDDELEGGEGQDTLKGNAGNDRIIWKEGDGSDSINGGGGADALEINYAGNATLAAQGDKAVFERKGSQPFQLTADNVEEFRVTGSRGKDSLQISDLSGTDVTLVTFSGRAGNDTLDGSKTSTNLVVNGGAGQDLLTGGNGNDTISSGRDTDTVNSGAGTDRIIWNEGDGNDRIDAGTDIDVVEENFSGDTVLQLSDEGNGKVSFGRTGAKPFTMTIDNAETFEINGAATDDSLTVKSLAGSDVTLINFSGGDGNDTLDARATSTLIVANGGAGDDTLIGGLGTIVGANGAVTGDRLTGGLGRDKFQFSTDPFAGKSPAQNLNQPDVITDYTIGQDQLVFDRQVSGLNTLAVQVGNSAAISGDSNVLVLTNGFANAGAAAQAIAANNAITAGKGVFVYFNTTLGFSRTVYSNDLANGGTFSVLANLTNQTNVANQANFSTADFGLV